MVVALHGLGATNASLLPTIWELAADHRVIAPDLPGHGDSGKPIAPYNSRWFGEWLTAFCNALRLDEVVLLGNSLGGRIALEGGLRMADRVRGLVLFTPSPAFRRLRQFIPFVRLLRPELAAVPLPMPHALAKQGRDVLVPSSFSRHVVEAVPRARSEVLPERTHELVREFLGELP